jgi:hypothetical protein
MQIKSSKITAQAGEMISSIGSYIAEATTKVAGTVVNLSNLKSFG